MSGELTTLDWFAVASGVASIYGAFVSWKQNRAARTEREIAEAAVDRVLAEQRRWDIREGFALAIFGGRRAESLLPYDAPRAREQIVDVLHHVSRLSGVEGTGGTPLGWQRIVKRCQDLIAAIDAAGIGSAPSPGFLAESTRELLTMISELERLAAAAAARTGGNYARHG